MPSLEDDVISLVRSLAADLGPGRVAVSIEEGKGFAASIQLQPRNSNAAKMLIGVDNLAGIHLYFGQDCLWEGDHCSDQSQTERCLRFLETICRAIMNGEFEEVAWFVRDKSSGEERVAAARGVVRVADRQLKFRNGLPGLRLPFVRMIKRDFKYEPYT